METLKRIYSAGCVEVRQLYIAAGHNFFGHHGQPPGKNSIVEVPEVECVAGRGLRCDRFFDFKENYKGQITFFAWETYEAICRELGVRNRSPSEGFEYHLLAIAAGLVIVMRGSGALSLDRLLARSHPSFPAETKFTNAATET